MYVINFSNKSINLPFGVKGQTIFEPHSVSNQLLMKESDVKLIVTNFKGKTFEGKITDDKSKWDLVLIPSFSYELELISKFPNGINFIEDITNFENLKSYIDELKSK